MVVISACSKLGKRTLDLSDESTLPAKKKAKLASGDESTTEQADPPKQLSKEEKKARKKARKVK